MALWDRERDRELDPHRLAVRERPVTLRLATEADRGALERLAGLDSRPLPAGPLLIAEVAGRIDAALSLSTDELVADPFRRTAELCELLRCRAGHLRRASPPSPSPRLQPRPLPVAT